MKRLVFLLCVLPSLAAESRPTVKQVEFFENKVRPLLVDQCVRCHGPKKQQGGLRLDTAEGLRAGGDGGIVVVPGKPEQSRLIKAVRHVDLKMPPKSQLSKEEIAVLNEWVRQGAHWPATQKVVRKPGVITEEDRQFWAFRPLQSPQLPKVTHSTWIRNPIDRFILAGLESRSLVPVDRADRRTLLRRVTFDLTGLPPTMEEIDAFDSDMRPDAYERVVDRLLGSPAYGERWGRHWLDVVRYADTAGDNSDYPIPQMYRYRNWVLQAFNRDRPYDLFLEEQIAGDLMPGKTREETNDRLIATGYLAGTRRFGSYEDKRYQWYLTYEDTIENLGRTVLGLSLSCSRCHDHKFDPIPSEDYYALYGFFRSTRYPWPGIELDKVQRDLVPLASPDELARAQKERSKKIAELDKQIRDLQQAKKTKEVLPLRRQRDRLKNSPLPVEMVYAVAEGKRWVGNAKFQLRGDPEREGKEVQRRFLSILGGQRLPQTEKGSGRLQLAKWLTDEKNPLTARVMVNRLWLYHFGRGIVPTPNDFGKQGMKPTHPELLDYLAGRFIESDWSIKAMHRLMVLSATYQLGSKEHEANTRTDPNNESYWRYNRRRLDAEAIRDNLLSLAGLLDRTPGGAHPFPEMSKWDFTQHKPFKAVYETDRRSVYLMTQRIQRHPYLALFDGPDTNASTAKRDSSTTPLQALYLMNDPFTHRLAEAFARRLLQEASSETQRIERAFLLAFGRQPTSEEQSTVNDYLRQIREKLARSNQGEQAVWESFARAIFLSNELIYIN